MKKSKVLMEKEILLPPLPKKSIDYRLQTTEPKKITPVLSSSSFQSPPSEKPRLDDVKFVRKTAGPAEELRTLTLVAFRRLSQDPKERTLKIHDKIELLKGESYEHYVAGIRGWQESEPNRLYLEVSRAALNTGTAVPELLKSRTAGNLPTLTLEEFQAILQLNSQLKF